MTEQEPTKVLTTVVVVGKDGVNSDKLIEIPGDQPPVTGGMYVYKYVTAQLGRRIRITLEPADDN